MSKEKYAATVAVFFEGLQARIATLPNKRQGIAFAVCCLSARIRESVQCQSLFGNVEALSRALDEGIVEGSMIDQLVDAAIKLRLRERVGAAQESMIIDIIWHLKEYYINCNAEFLHRIGEVSLQITIDRAVAAAVAEHRAKVGTEWVAQNANTLEYLTWFEAAQSAAVESSVCIEEMKRQYACAAAAQHLK